MFSLFNIYVLRQSGLLTLLGFQIGMFEIKGQDRSLFGFAYSRWERKIMVEFLFMHFQI